MAKWIVVGITTYILSLAGFGLLAAQGSVLGGLVLGIMATIGLVSFGVLLSLVSSAASAKREQTNFLLNAKENLALIQETQKAQNLQAQGMVHQMKAGQYLNGGYDNNDPPALSIIPGVFDGLE